MVERVGSESSGRGEVEEQPKVVGAGAAEGGGRSWPSLHLHAILRNDGLHMVLLEDAQQQPLLDGLVIDHEDTNRHPGEVRVRLWWPAARATRAISHDHGQIMADECNQASCHAMH